jgi:hypothetical protein
LYSGYDVILGIHVVQSVIALLLFIVAPAVMAPQTKTKRS